MAHAKDSVKVTLDKSTEYRTEDDVIKISLHHPCRQTLKISFQRTVRVADGNAASFLPPSLGTFPLHSVEDHQPTLPPYIFDKGGFFTAMYPREAMWIRFKSQSQFAIRIFVGVNAVSGESEIETEQTKTRQAKLLAHEKCVQDYVVTPDQLWLDGIATTDGCVRQFVATPLGSGYSVEAQVTGGDLLGGLQIEVVPKKYSEIELQAMKQGQSSILIKDLAGGIMSLYCSLSDTIDEVKHLIQNELGVPLDQQRLIYSGRQLDDHNTLREYDICNGDVICLVLRLRGGGSPPKDWQMGVAAGGLIKQTIMRDNYPSSSWDFDKAIYTSVQILDPRIFTMFTGLLPPNTPITAETYAEHGLPYFDIYDEEPSGIVGHFDGVKSITKLDGTTESPHNNPVVKLDKGGRVRRPFKPIAVLEKELREVEIETETEG